MECKSSDLQVHKNYLKTCKLPLSFCGRRGRHGSSFEDGVWPKFVGGGMASSKLIVQAYYEYDLSANHWSLGAGLGGASSGGGEIFVD